MRQECKLFNCGLRPYERVQQFLDHGRTVGLNLTEYRFERGVSISIDIDERVEISYPKVPYVT